MSSYACLDCPHLRDKPSLKGWMPMTWGDLREMLASLHIEDDTPIGTWELDHPLKYADQIEVREDQERGGIDVVQR